MLGACALLLGMVFLFPLPGDCTAVLTPFSPHATWCVVVPVKLPTIHGVGKPPEAGAKGTWASLGKQSALTARRPITSPSRIHYSVTGSLVGILSWKQKMVGLRSCLL